MKCPYCQNEMRKGRIKAVSHKDTDWRLGGNLGYAFFEEEHILANLHASIIKNPEPGEREKPRESNWLLNVEINGCHFCPHCSKVVIDLLE